MTQLIWHVSLTFPQRLYTLAMPHVLIRKGTRMPCATPVSLAKSSRLGFKVSGLSGSAFCTAHIGIPRQAQGWFPPAVGGLVMKD